MPKVITNKKIRIGAYLFPDRKKPSLCIEQGAEITIMNCFYIIKTPKSSTHLTICFKIGDIMFFQTLSLFHSVFSLKVQISPCLSMTSYLS